MSFNDGITDKGAKLLIAGLEKNHTITEIMLHFNEKITPVRIYNFLKNIKIQNWGGIFVYVEPILLFFSFFFFSPHSSLLAIERRN